MKCLCLKYRYVWILVVYNSLVSERLYGKNKEVRFEREKNSNADLNLESLPLDKFKCKKIMKRISEKIASLDPESDYAQIVDLMANWQDSLPFLHHMVYTLGFIRQVADPDIAETIYNNGAGKIFKSVYARGNEALQFFGNWYKNGPESEKGIQSIGLMNKIHEQFEITNEQYLYTLATAAVSADHYRKLVGLKENTQNEKIAFAKFWKEVGKKMNLRDIPQSYIEFDSYYEQYEKKHFKRSNLGLLCCEIMVEDFSGRWFKTYPKLGRKFLLAHFDEELQEVYPLDYPGEVLTKLVRKTSWFLGWYIKHFQTSPKKARYVENYFGEEK